VPRNGRATGVALLATPLLLASCYSFATPSYHPGEARDLVAAVARHGATIRTAVPGDSACDDPGLVANAVHLAVTDPADGADRDVWVYSFRERYWDSSKASVDACQAAFETAHPGAVVTRLDVPLYRAFGADWSDDLTEDVRAGLAEASEAGEP
jgi:hypothetical protein